MKKKKTLKTRGKHSPQRERRFFSETARRTIVQEIETQGISKAEAARKYQVSEVSIYRWIQKYSDKYQAPLRKIVEHESDSKKNVLLSAELSSTYEALGRLQAENMLLRGIIEQASEYYEEDLKKNFAKQSSLISTTIKKK